MSRWIGILLILTSLLMSMALFSVTRRAEDMNARFEFREIAVASVESVERRLDSYGQVVRGVAAYLSVTESVSLMDFNEYVSGLKLEQRYGGIRGVGFVRAIDAAGVPFIERSLSEQHGTEVRVHPVTDHDERFVLTRMMPLAPNRKAIGLDLSFDEGRRALLIAARETGELMMSHRVKLVQDVRGQAGFFLVRAVFDNAYDRESGTTVRGDFLGWVVAPFIGADLLSAATHSMGRQYHLRVYDAPGRTPADLVFDSGMTPETAGDYTQSFELSLYGQDWYVTYASTPAFDRTVSSYLPHALAGLGLLLTALIAMLVKFSQLRSDTLAAVAEQRARQLGAREDENRALLDTALSAVMILDENGRIIFANAAVSDLFDQPHETFEGRDFGDLVALKPGRGGKLGYNAEGRGAEGRKLFLDVETNGWNTADGEGRVTAIVRDVTDVIEARAQVDAVRQRYDVALAGAEIGIFELDLVTGEAEMSDTWHKILGTADLEGPFDHRTHFLDRVHPDDLPALQDSDRRCIEGETYRTIAEYRVRFGDGWRWMYSDAIAVERDVNGRGTRLIGTQSDITEIRHARNALEVSEDRFRMVLEDAPVGMALMDAGGTFTGVNNALVKLSGFPRQELVGEKRMSDLILPEDYERIAGELREILRNSHMTTYQTEARVRTRSGEERWGLINVSWTHDKNREENVYIAQVVDITDQKKVEQIKSEFVATVSHELRTPLTSIKGALGLLGATEAKNMSKSTARLLEIARVNADRLTTIVNDILDLEKISSGEVVFEIQNTSLGDLVATSLDEMAPFAEEHGNTLSVAAPERDLVVRIDANRTRQVMANLLSNACKYSDPDTEVTLRYERLGDAAIVFIQNTGPGIPESFRDRIFEAFTQADGSDTRSKGGTGLGLNITRQIVMRQNGRIGFESTPDGLTVFWFTVPLVEVDALVTRDEPAQAPGAAQKTLKVLHVEDDRDFADVIRAGCAGVAKVTHAPTIAAARDALADKRWDIVLIDWTLPDGDARVLLDEVRAAGPDTRVIVLSAASASTEDPLIDVALIKSQVEMQRIVQVIRNVGSEPRRSARSF